jgi:hypothetical protein
MWAALLGLLVELVRLLLFRLEAKRRLTDAERDLAEQAVGQAHDAAKAKLIAARDQVRKEREVARKHYAKAAGDSGATGSDD